MDPPPTSATSNTTLSTPPAELTLYYNPLSPFVRKVWLTALELRLTRYITLHKVLVAPSLKPRTFPAWSQDNDLVGSYNPVGKIPTLLVKYPDQSEFAIYDSKVICEFLESLVGKGEEVVRDATYWKRQTLHRAADQMLDARILIVYEERIREPEEMFFKPWVDGQNVKIERGFDVFLKAVEDGTLRTRGGAGEEGDEVREFGLEEAAVVCCLANADHNKREWRAGRKALAEWFEVWKRRPSFAASQGNVAWVGKEI